MLGEHYSHKISTEFESESTVNSAVDSLIRADIPQSQVEIVRPDDPNIAIKVEPEVKGVARSLAKTHAMFGFVGLLAGLVLAALLVEVGPPLTQSSPVMTFIAACFVCTALGLLLAGAIALRPDHDPFIEKTRKANKAGRWTVIVHCESREQQKKVKEVIGSDTQTW